MYYLSVRYLKKGVFIGLRFVHLLYCPKQNKRCQFLTLVCFWSCIWYTDEWRFSAAADNCLETFENSMENNKRLLEEQDCPCDTEHMWSCPAGQQTVTSKGAGGQAALSKVMSELAQLHSAQGLSLVSYWFWLARVEIERARDWLGRFWLVGPTSVGNARKAWCDWESVRYRGNRLVTRRQAFGMNWLARLLLAVVWQGSQYWDNKGVFREIFNSPCTRLSLKLSPTATAESVESCLSSTGNSKLKGSGFGWHCNRIILC